MERDITLEMKNHRVAKDKAVYRFEKIVFPAIKDSFGPKCEYISIESLKDDDTLSNRLRRVFSLLDNVCGIDGLIIDPYKGVKTVANRVQPIKYGNNPFNTFTIRDTRPNGYKTEYEKRLEAIKLGYLYPILTTQSFISENEETLLSFGVCNTKDLYTYTEHNEIKTRYNSHDDVGFKYVNWSDLDKEYDLLIYKENDNTQSQTVYKKYNMSSSKTGYPF